MDKFTWNFESPGQMRSQRFYTEDFRGVMSAEQKIHAELFSRHGSPVRSFATSPSGAPGFIRNYADCQKRESVRIFHFMFPERRKN
jgi:hypothetical protein